MIIIPSEESELRQPYIRVSENQDDIDAQELKKNQLFEDIERLLKPRFETAPFDARFPNTNQTKNCWQNYVDYQKCIKAKGEDYEPCQKFKWIYKIICPNKWTDRWDEFLAAGTFHGNTEPPKL